MRYAAFLRVWFSDKVVCGLVMRLSRHGFRELLLINRLLSLHRHTDFLIVLGFLNGARRL